MDGRYCQCHSFNITKHLTWAHSNREKDGALHEIQNTEFNLELCERIWPFFSFVCFPDQMDVRVPPALNRMRPAKKKRSTQDTRHVKLFRYWWHLTLFCERLFIHPCAHGAVSTIYSNISFHFQFYVFTRSIFCSTVSFFFHFYVMLAKWAYTCRERKKKLIWISCRMDVRFSVALEPPPKISFCHRKVAQVSPLTSWVTCVLCAQCTVKAIHSKSAKETTARLTHTHRERGGVK